MGYTGSYSLGVRCLAEGLGMCLVIWAFEAGIANEQLPHTKGQAMGWGWICFGAGLAFLWPILWLGFISAFINPAFALSAVILGQISFTDWIAISCCEIVGAFLGAVLVYITYLPHFKTIPTPSAPDGPARVLHLDAPIEPESLRVSSFHSRRFERPKSLKELAQDVSYYVTNTPEHQLSIGQRRLSSAGSVKRPASAGLSTVHEVSREHDHSHDETHEPLAVTRVGTATPETSALRHPSNSSQSADDEIYDAAFEAAIKADQASKLAIFATRPAIYNPVTNFIVEFLGTLILTLGANLMGPRGLQMLGQNVAYYDNTWDAYFVGIFIIMVVLNFGGPTGVAINPARDFGPRLAHQLLPIPGKGPSEWHYAPIPIIAPFGGAAAAAGIFLLMEKMFLYPQPGGGYASTPA